MNLKIIGRRHVNWCKLVYKFDEWISPGRCTKRIFCFCSKGESNQYELVRGMKWFGNVKNYHRKWEEKRSKSSMRRPTQDLREPTCSRKTFLAAFCPTSVCIAAFIDKWVDLWKNSAESKSRVSFLCCRTEWNNDNRNPQEPNMNAPSKRLKKLRTCFSCITFIVQSDWKLQVMPTYFVLPLLCCSNLQFVGEKRLEALAAPLLSRLELSLQISSEESGNEWHQVIDWIIFWYWIVKVMILNWSRRDLSSPFVVVSLLAGLPHSNHLYLYSESKRCIQW